MSHTLIHFFFLVEESYTCLSRCQLIILFVCIFFSPLFRLNFFLSLDIAVTNVGSF